MAKKVTDSPTKLTEFAPLSSDSKPTGNFFSRLFKKSSDGSEEKNSGSYHPYNQPYSQSPPDVVTSKVDADQTPQQAQQDTETEEGDESRSDSEASSASLSSLTGVAQTRNLSSVLKRLSNILDRRSVTPQAYKDSDFKQYWMPDNNCKECYECGDKFNTFRRRHHCRICGQIFCSRCCNQEVPGKIMGYTGLFRALAPKNYPVDFEDDKDSLTGYLRVCTYCCKVVLSYAQNYAQNPETSGDLRALSEELKHLANIDSEGQQTTDLWTPTSRRKHIFDEEQYKRSNSPDIISPGSNRNPFDLTPQSEYSSFDSFQHERRLLTQDSVQLRDLWLLMQHPVDGIETQSHRHRLRTYPNCFVGSEVVDWLLARDKVANREQAVAIGQAMVDAKWLECVTSNDSVFRDEYALYRQGAAAPNVQDSSADIAKMCDTSLIEDDDAEPLWFREIKGEDSESGSDFSISASDPLRSNTVFYSEPSDQHDPPKRPKKPRNASTDKVNRDLEPWAVGSNVSNIKKGSQDTTPPYVQLDCAIGGIQHITEEFVLSGETAVSPLEEGLNLWQGTDHLREENGERQAFEILRKAHKEHMTTLANQLLSRAGLSLKWVETVMQIIHKISLVVRPDVKHEGDDMDIRQYVQIKKLAGGSRSNTSIVCGVVCTKNVTHKKMRQHIQNPKILLLRAPLEYQRVENKFSSLEPQILQEFEFLRHCVGRIAALKPDVLLVEKAVSRVAQDFLLDAGITLIINVKPSVMQRVSRFTQADIVTSIDGLVSKTTLGFCHTFKINTFTLPDGHQKSLMYFDGCASHLGCTVILRGGSTMELAKVKRILLFMTYVAYHSKLEISFLMDEFAMPPVDQEENLLDLGVQTPTYEPEGLLTGKAEVCSQAAEDDVQNSSTQDDAKDNNSTKTETAPSTNESVEGKKESSPKTEVKKEVKSTEKSLLRRSDDQPNKSKRVSSRGEMGGTTIEDFSDPLQSYQKNKDDSVFHRETKQCLKEEKPANTYKFKATLQDVVISCSPYIRYEVPYLETDAGSMCKLRQYFPKQIYWSQNFESQPQQRDRSRKLADSDKDELSLILSEPVDGRFCDEEEQRKRELEISNNLNLLPPHCFVNLKITAAVTDSKNQALLADFRATGGRIWLNGCDEAKQNEEKRNEKIEKNNNAYHSKGIDCLDPYNHQRIAVLFSSFCYESANSPNPCVNPWVVSMDFYGRNDISLGGFLERYCFRENYQCPSESCDTPMVEHIRRFIHETGCITIILKKLDMPLRGHPSNTIYMWEWCRKCKEVTPVVPASVDTWSMSFAKYLELRFHGNMYARRGCEQQCSHSLHHDHFQYFGFNHIVASFKHSHIQLKEIALPPIVIEIDEPSIPLTSLVDSAKMLSFRGTGAFSTIMEHLHRLKRDAQSTAQTSLLNDYISEVQHNKEVFRGKIDEIQTWLASIAARCCENMETDVEQIMVEVPEVYELADGLTEVKRLVAEAVYSWNNRIMECDQQQKKLEKMKIQTPKDPVTKSSKETSDSATPESATIPIATIPIAVTSSSTWHAKDLTDDLDPVPKISIEIAFEDSNSLSETISDKDLSAEAGSEGPAEVTDSTTMPPSGIAKDVLQRLQTETVFAGSSLDCGIAAACPSYMDSEEDVLMSIKTEDLEVPIIQGQGSPDLFAQQKSKSAEAKKTFKQVSHENSSSDLEKLEKNRATVKNIFSSLLSSSDVNPVTTPFSAEEHHLLPPGERIPVVVLDQEPSSIIAYTLSSAEYQMQLQELKSMMGSARESQSSSPMVKRVKKSDGTSTDLLDIDGARKSGSSVLAFFRGNGREKSPQRPVGSSGGKIDTVRYTPNLDQNSLDETDDFSYFGDISDPVLTKSAKSKVQPSTNYHIELQFSDNTAKFYCRVYYAEQFQKLRKLIFPEGEERYIRSLSNCFNWLARGGKSGSLFCKTQDDRFILKQMSRLEVQSFGEFAPGYFQYVTKAFNEQMPTVLAKILGVYRIGYRNSHTGRELKQDLLVMENLFYKRKITQIFDLKGSMRNRMVNTSGKRIEDLVLLDENLLKSSLDNPMYIRPHSKTVLTLAITNDTQFLSTNLVMDYSLLVGLDETNKELVVGIIDYIRTFTWDKKLEMVVKSTYSQLGGQGKMPTVVSPELYRSRFLEAMDRYFLLVPDRWTGLGRNVDC